MGVQKYAAPQKLSPRREDGLAIIGRKPSCGHVVAIDLDDTPEHRADFVRRGYTVETHPRSVAVQMMDREHAQCMLSNPVTDPGLPPMSIDRQVG